MSVLFADAQPGSHQIPLASYICIAVFVLLVAFVIWGLCYTSYKRGAGVEGILGGVGAAVGAGLTAFCMIFFALPFGGPARMVIIFGVGFIGQLIGKMIGRSMKKQLPSNNAME